MSIQRLRTLQAKQTAIAKSQRRAMADLLSTHKLESARIRVEAIIRSDITTELHEILELYCELLLARISLLDGPLLITNADNSTRIVGGKSGMAESEANVLDDGLDEAVRSIMYAAPRVEIKELQSARALLVEKMGKEYAVSASEAKGVPERVVKRVRVETPKKELVDAYLREIGRTYGVRFPGDPETDDEVDEDEAEADDAGDEEGKADGGDDDGEAGGGKKVSTLEREDLARATPPRDLGETRSPLRIAPPSPSTENPGPTVKLPGGAAPKPVAKRKKSASTEAPKTTTGTTPKPKAKDKADGPGGQIPDVDELTKRFAALKRK
ncbi:DUF292-domain-containing protein [Microthyrium microscopicum]|uniref:DUF292-domain-containing protein n=1 Tax=Microthyrium microscopicum TaxID=703497 RepID=A0A6A6TZE9_9PEZI|nr:DUF292-domain-containing protein [Microthyrium microscopicum]